MTSSESIDPYLVTAIKLLHSSAQDSAEKLRIMLDSEISKNHEKSKLITNLLTKKQLNDEKNAPGSGFKKHKPKKPEEVKMSVRQPTPDPEVIPILDDDESSTEKKSEIDDEMDYSDFTCVTCMKFDSSANNQLFECIKCHLLHHQLCHIPKISSETNTETWICETCSCKEKKEKESSTKSTKSYESSSSSSSNSSSKKLSISTPIPEKKTEVKKKGKESSSSSSSSRSRSSKR